MCARRHHRLADISTTAGLQAAPATITLGDLVRYQRQVIGYHGCPREVADAVLAGERKLTPSRNPYDWLGSGIYFWEYGPDRALDWAKASLRRRKRSEGDAAVLGAIIELGECFDLLDLRYTSLLERAHRDLGAALRARGDDLPVNADPNPDGDVIKRHLDSVVIEFAIKLAEDLAEEEGKKLLYHTVRGAFEEGGPAFPGACVRRKTHVQVAVRDPGCIIGYFRPSM